MLPTTEFSDIIPATLVVGLQFSSVSFFCGEFQDRQILFGSISFPFYVDIVIETKGGWRHDMFLFILA